MREEKNNEINLLKLEITKLNKELNSFTKKAELFEKKLDDEKQKNFMIQNKLDKKSKELSEMNEYTKKLLTNKDNLISQYEEKIEEITKDKNDLISQNKQLLENIKLKKENHELNGQINTENKNDDNKDIQQYIQENKLLKEEIKELKEQIENQAKDLMDLNSFEKEIVRLKAQNESLIKDNKTIKTELDEYKKNEEVEFNLEGGDELNSKIGRPKKRGQTIINDKIRRKSLNGKKSSFEAQITQINFRKQLNALKKIKEEEEKDFNERINKMYVEIAELKVKNLNLTYVNDELKIKYKNRIKSVTNQCNKKGIKLKFHP